MINFLWYFGGTWKLALAGTLVRRGLRRSHGVLVAFLLISLAKSAWLASVTDYKGWWIRLQPIDLALGALLVIEAVRLIAAHYPHSQRFATYTTVIFASVAVVVVVSTSDVLSPYCRTHLSWLVWLTRQWTAACLLVVVMTASFYSRAPGEWSSNTLRYLTGTVFLFVMELAGAGAYAYHQPSARVLLLLAPIAACCCWAAMDGKGERV